MKYSILFGLTLLIHSKHYAQIEKGTIVPSAMINCGYLSSPINQPNVGSTESYKWNAAVTGGLGKFIKDNVLLTGSLNYGYSYVKFSHTDYQVLNNDYGNTIYSNTYGVNLGLYKYKFIKENFALRLGFNVGAYYSDGIAKNSFFSIITDSLGSFSLISNHEEKYQNNIRLQGNLQAGILYFVSHNLAITGNMGFLSASYSMSPYEKSKNKDIKAHTLNLSLSPSFNAFSVGLTYYMRPKQ